MIRVYSSAFRQTNTHATVAYTSARTFVHTSTLAYVHYHKQIHVHSHTLIHNILGHKHTHGLHVTELNGYPRLLSCTIPPTKVIITVISSSQSDGTWILEATLKNYLDPLLR